MLKLSAFTHKVKLRSLACIDPALNTIENNSEIAIAYLQRPDPLALRVIQTTTLLGRFFVDDDFKPGNQQVAVLSYQFWQQKFLACYILARSATRDPLQALRTE